MTASGSFLGLSMLLEASTVTIVLLAVLAIVLLVVAIVVVTYLGLWLQAYMAGARVSIFQIVAMRMRKVNPGVIVRSKIMAVQADVPIETRQIEAHYLAGGNVPNVVRALIAADRADRGSTSASPRESTSRDATCWKRCRPA
jgi:uncharacterized protein YqfA (UPF0365 family)